MSEPADAVTGDLPDEERVIAKLSNEFATIWLELDRAANGPRLVVHSLRDHERVELDPMSLSLLCQVDGEVLALLADIARDPRARPEFNAWMESQRAARSQDASGTATATEARRNGSTT